MDSFTHPRLELNSRPCYLYRMWLIRYFDEGARALFMANLLRGTTHTYTGQEAVAVGACAALSRDDYITSTHRGHGHCLAKGGDLRRMMAELLGRATGYCKGKGGSMHIADLELGILGANGIVGGGIGLATGAAYSADRARHGPGGRLLLRRRRQQPGHPDGGRQHGRPSGSCRSSTSARTTSTPSSVPAGPSSRSSGWSARRRRSACRPSPWTATTCWRSTRRPARRSAQARAGGGPTFLVAQTYRIEGHTVGDPLNYRPKEEAALWKSAERDPISRFGRRLVAEFGFSRSRPGSAAPNGPRRHR